MQLFAEAHEVALAIAKEARDHPNADAGSDGLGQCFGVFRSYDSRRLAGDFLEPTKTGQIADAVWVADDAMLNPFRVLAGCGASFGVGLRSVDGRPELARATHDEISVLRS